MSDLQSFAAIILTYRRPNAQHTRNTLRREGYTGRIVLLLSEDDPTLPEYRALYGDEVETFSRDDYWHLDRGDNAPNLNGVFPARAAAQKWAEDHGLDYWWMLDDDYANVMHRWMRPGGVVVSRVVRDMDELCLRMLMFLEDTGARSVAFSQGGDHMGRKNLSKHLIRKVMNTHFIKTKNPVDFHGRINEDVNAYTVGGARGELFLTLLRLQVTQPDTQQVAGGMTDAYQAGTYVKTFMSVMMAPSSVQVWVMPTQFQRIHHRVMWRHAAPYIISDRHRKPETADVTIG